MYYVFYLFVILVLVYLYILYIQHREELKKHTENFTSYFEQKPTYVQSNNFQNVTKFSRYMNSSVSTTNMLNKI